MDREPSAPGPRTPGAGRWVVLYDGECGFCKWLLAGFLRWDRGGRLVPMALQCAQADALLGDLEREQRLASWHLVSPAGERRSGAAALPALLRLLPAGALPAAAFALLPGVSDRAYRWVASHRTQISRWVPAGAKRRASAHVRARERDEAA
jgi:predicted DCC family thiol-disulfide oxidoreductase YuxK